MFLSLWRKSTAGNRVPRPRACPLRARLRQSRPRLEPLEDRTPPATCAVGAIGPAAAASAICRAESVANPVGGAGLIRVTVPAGSPQTVLDLGRVFAGVGGLHHTDGLKLSVLGNTNSALVATDLSESALTLSYMPRQWGAATITVGATDADGVSVQGALLVRVLPVSPPSTVVVAPNLAGPLVLPVGTFW